jgi:hypothetical protein
VDLMRAPSARLMRGGQAAAEALMVDACTIRRLTGTVTDKDSGDPVKTWDDLYAGKCRIQQGLAQAAQQDAGEDYLLQLRLEVQLPVAVVALEVNDEITVTTSQDPDLVGRVFLVRDLFHKTHLTARRVGATERSD